MVGLPPGGQPVQGATCPGGKINWDTGLRQYSEIISSMNNYIGGSLGVYRLTSDLCVLILTRVSHNLVLRKLRLLSN